MPKLFMVLIGCTPAGRHTEQHDIYFGIGESMKDLAPGMVAFWPEAKGRIHIDAWREVTAVNGHSVTVMEGGAPTTAKLFFINLGGYKQGEFDELHYKMVIAAPDKGKAIQEAKRTAFFKHTGFKGATSHVDDKYGVDVDDFFEIKDILPTAVKSRYSLVVTPTENGAEDEMHLGYFKLDAVEKWGG